MRMSPELVPVNQLMLPQMAHSVYGEQVLLAHLRKSTKDATSLAEPQGNLRTLPCQVLEGLLHGYEWQ